MRENFKEITTSRWYFDLTHPLPRLQIKQLNVLFILPEVGEHWGVGDLSSSSRGGCSPHLTLFHIAWLQSNSSAPHHQSWSNIDRARDLDQPWWPLQPPSTLICTHFCSVVIKARELTWWILLSALTLMELISWKTFLQCTDRLVSSDHSPQKTRKKKKKNILWISVTFASSRWNWRLGYIPRLRTEKEGCRACHKMPRKCPLHHTQHVQARHSS